VLAKRLLVGRGDVAGMLIVIFVHTLSENVKGETNWSVVR
jgi:hypothetical protein